MVKDDIINSITQDTGYGKNVVSCIIDSMLKNITNALASGDKVQFLGFGTFEPKYRAARIGRNPRTKEAVHIPAKVTPSFSVGSKFKKAVEKEI